ncbi:hypothetical protein [Herpetosiphon geysericola]|uniref:Uncharacterized protein n=1 Tax=Herpetosiphon geysericola TaxID=70996 RepID=A0A0P6XK90_9CHLR|nr:hypothetical protein [Herpetosiphon geysericola]KPL80611.1 hypothetical protein SE18_23625 [Herpetosiphon geysericola]
MPSTHPSGGAEVMRTPPWLSPPDTAYLWIPTKLIETLAHAPLALGIYALIVRRWLVTQCAVPISAADLHAYDPSLTRSMIRTALAQLVRGQWIAVPTEPQPGRKIAYLPTWGRQREGVRLWDQNQPAFNRGRVATHRLDRNLLDGYLGRFEPQLHGQPRITRYLTDPVLTLTDVGVYLLLLVGVPHDHPTTTLTKLGLCQDTIALAVPTLREIVQQGTLSLHGAQRFNLVPRGGIARPMDADPRPPLFFVDPNLATIMVSTMATNLAMTDTPSENGCSPSEWPQSLMVDDTCTVTGRLTKKSRINQPSENTLHSIQYCDGLSFSDSENVENEAVSDQGSRNPKTKNIPRRRNIMSIPETPSATRLRSIDVWPQTCAELADVPLDVIEACIADGKARPAVRDLAAWTVAMVRDVQKRGWEAARKQRGEPPTDAWRDPDAMFAKFNARRDRVDETVAAAPDTVLEETPPLDAIAPPVDTTDDDDCPDWIAPARWQTLWRPLRHALYRSRLRGRTVIACDSWRQHQLTEYKDEITSLVIAASMRRC